MKNNYYLRLILLVALFGCWSKSFAQYPAGSPVALNGKLKVVGAQLTSECGNPVQLKGMSTHGLQWNPGCSNASSLTSLVSDWKVDIIRLAMYVTKEELGYENDPVKWKGYLDNLVDECAIRGIYCIIDWHILKNGNPNDNITSAKEFWTYMSKTHAGKDHVIYEICNEPNSGGGEGPDWSIIKSYANTIIPIIRANDPATIIIVGTPGYSSHPELAAASKLEYTNIMYALHFYSASHGKDYRDRAEAAIKNGAAVFVSEFGTTDATGDGNPSIGGSDEWMNWMDQNKISWCNWSFSDVDEGSAALLPGSCGTEKWTATTASGSYIKGKLAGTRIGGDCKTNIVPPKIEIIAPLNNSGLIAPADLTIEAKVTPGAGTIVKVNFYNGNVLLGSDDSEPYTYTLKQAPVGVYSIKAQAVTSDEGVVGLAPGIVVFVNVPQSPYKGTPWPVPGKIEVENYDIGGNNNAYFDVDLGNTGAKYREDDVDIEDANGIVNIGFAKKGEWLEYSVNVASTEMYSIDFRVASGIAGEKKMHLEVDTIDVTGPVTVNASASWSDYTTVNVPKVFIPSGLHTLRLAFDTDNINIDNFEIKSTGITGMLGDESVYGNSVNLYPNPTSSSFTYKVVETIKNLSVVNSLGELVESQENIQKNNLVTLGSQLNAGTYILKVQYETGKTEVLKMVKVK